MRIFDEFYKSLSKRERRQARREERERELLAIKRNRFLRRIFFWTVFVVLVLACSWLVVYLANQKPYQP